MACILCPECNFMHGYFRCQLPMETVDVEVEVKTIHGIHMFRRDRTSQVIKCNPWSTRLCTYPSLVWKMTAYLELEGRLGPKSKIQLQTQLQPTPLQQVHAQQNQQRPAKPSTNPRVRKSPACKVNDKRRKTVIAKRRYKVRVLTQPTPSTPTLTAPTPMVVTVSTQTPMRRSTAESILVTIHKLATGQFAEVPCPTTRSISDNPPPLEDIPSVPVRQGTPWPNAGLASENLFETRKDWPIPTTSVPTPTPTIKTEEHPKIAAIPHAMTMPKQATEKCAWGLHCPICKNKEEHGEEDWDGNLQNQPRTCPQNLQPHTTRNSQPQNLQCPKPQTLQHPQSQSSQHAEKKKLSSVSAPVTATATKLAAPPAKEQ